MFSVLAKECGACLRRGHCAVEEIFEQGVWGDVKRVTDSDVAGAIVMEGLSVAKDCAAVMAVEALESGTVARIDAQIAKTL